MTLDEAIAAAAQLVKSGDYSEAEPHHLVGLYARLHESTYGAPPGELATARAFRAAVRAAEQLIKAEFGGEVDDAITFMKWVWAREVRTEKKRRSEGTEGRRISWRLMFEQRHLITDWRVAHDRRGLSVPKAPKPEDKPEPTDDQDGVAMTSDLANAYRLRDQHGDDMRHVRGLGWMVYDGQRWAQDETAASRRAHAVAKSIFGEAADADGETAKKLAAWAIASQNRSGLKNMLDVASALEGLAAKVEDFDSDPMVLNALNGTVDLTTGELRPHRRSDLITKIAPVVYDPKARAPLFEQFLRRIFAGDAELIGFVQRSIGYSLSGSVAEQCFFLAYGTGANGKSTLLEVIASALGDYAANTSSDTFLRVRERGPDADLARLRGARFVTASESGEERRLDEERVKRITGGDRITARLLYRDHFEFTPSFKAWLSANHRPRIVGTDVAIWRRVRLIPFNVTIPENERDHELPAKLRAELPGILRWAVEGAVEWRVEGLAPPEVVLVAGREYRSDEDTFAQFLEAECEIDADHVERAGAIVRRCQSWAAERHEKILSEREIGNRLRQAGFEKSKARTGSVWRGLRLAPERLEDMGAALDREIGSVVNLDRARRGKS